MSRTVKGTKGPGYDYGAKRYGNKGGCNPPKPQTKRLTVRAERRIAKNSIHKEA